MVASAPGTSAARCARPAPCAPVHLAPAHLTGFARGSWKSRCRRRLSSPLDRWPIGVAITTPTGHRSRAARARGRGSRPGSRLAPGVAARARGGGSRPGWRLAPGVAARARRWRLAPGVAGSRPGWRARARGGGLAPAVAGSRPGWRARASGGGSRQGWRARARGGGLAPGVAGSRQGGGLGWQRGWSGSRAALAPAVGYRQPAVPAEILRRDLRARRVLAPLVFGGVDHPYNGFHQVPVDPAAMPPVAPRSIDDIVVEQLVEHP